MGETRVDLLHLLEDLRDAYPGAIEETIRLPMGRPGDGLGGSDLLVPLTPVHGEAPLAEAGATPGPAGQSRAPAADGDAPGTPPPASTDDGVPPALAPTATLPSERGRRQPGRYGLSLQFSQRPDDPELGRLIESTVWINEAHPAYRRAAASRSEGYHIAVAVALALAPLAVEPAKEHGFLTAFLSAWGAAMARRKRRGL